MGLIPGQIAIKVLKKVLWYALQMVESSWIVLMTWIKKLGKIKWAIGGNALYPDYNLKLEGAMPDIARCTAHTLMAYTKDKKVLLLITKANRSLADARKDLLSSFSLYSAINLDGGGSTSMIANGKVIKDQGRKLSTIVSIV